MNDATVDRSASEGVAALLRSHGTGPGHIDDIPALLRAAAEGGWLDLVGLGLSEGPDVGIEEALLACEVLGRQIAPLSLVAAAGFVQPLLTALGPGSFADRVTAWLDQGAVVAVPTTRVAPDGQGARFEQTGDVRSKLVAGVTRLSGSVDQLTDATARAIIVTVDGHTLAVVPVDAPGLTVHTVPSVVEGLDVARADFDEVAVDETLLHRSGVPEAIHRASVAWSLVLDAYAVGTCREMVARTVEFVVAREQFGQPVGRFQAVQHTIADMHIAAETSFSMLVSAARLWVERPEAALPEVIGSRLHAGASAISTCESAIQLHGGIGFTWEIGLHLWYRAAQFSHEYLTKETGMREFLAGCLDPTVREVVTRETVR